VEWQKIKRQYFERQSYRNDDIKKIYNNKKVIYWKKHIIDKFIICIYLSILYEYVKVTIWSDINKRT